MPLSRKNKINPGSPLIVCTCTCHAFLKCRLWLQFFCQAHNSNFAIKKTLFSKAGNYVESLRNEMTPVLAPLL